MKKINIYIYVCGYVMSWCIYASIYVCDVTHIFMCVTWLIHMCDMTYGCGHVISRKESSCVCVLKGCDMTHSYIPYATHCNTLQHTATHCNTLQHTATHCNTLQHTATHCNTLIHIYRAACVRVALRIYMCDMTHSIMWRNMGRIRVVGSLKW